MALVVKRYTLPVPFWDEWAWTSLIYRMHSGVLGLGDLWQQHDDERMLFPNLIALGLASLGGWDQQRETLFNVLLVVLTQIGVYVLLRRIVARERLPFAFLAASLLLYSLAQMENWDWGFQIAPFLCNACAVWALLLLGTTGQSWFALLAAIVIAAIASGSALAGLLVWVAGMGVLLLVEKRRPAQMAVWILAAAAVYAAYFQGYVEPRGGPEPLGGLHHPLAAAKSVAAYVGAVFGGWLDPRVAATVGALGIGLLAALLDMVVNEHRRDRAAGARAASLFGLAVYALSVAVLDAVGRSGFGAASPEASRSTSIGIYCWIVVIALLFGYADRFARRLPAPVVRLWPVVALVLGALYVGSSQAGLELGLRRLALVDSALPALAAGVGPQLTLLFPSEPAIEEYLRELKSIKDGPYYE